MHSTGIAASIQVVPADRPASLRHPARLSRAAALLAGLVVTALGGCGTRHDGVRPDVTPAVPVRATQSDLLWLERVTFGIDSRSVADLGRLGRAGLLDQQLGRPNPTLPAPVARELASLEVVHLDVPKEIVAVRQEQKRIRELADPAAQQDARAALTERGKRLEFEASRRLLLQAVYSRDQLREQMVWFWLNHFSVFQHKAELRWLVGDYEATAIRPHALGHFRDLVLAALEHPAMLQYLDNAQNAAGHLNENYARELMELHTLGVSAGYSQRDVQELARVLTGVGIWGGGDPPRLRPDRRQLYRRVGAMEFNPARHDFGVKTLLGQRIGGQGFAEVERAVDLLVSTPACAHFVSRRLATYFVADLPPETLVDRLAAVFQRTNGDIAAVLRALFRSPEIEASLGQKFRDPYHYVVGALRLAYDGRPFPNAQPPMNWLEALGEAPYSHLTPDGYPLTENGWASSGQLSRRFEIARAIAAGNAGTLEQDPSRQQVKAGVPSLATRLYTQAVEPRLSTRTRGALDQAASQLEWNTLLLASPELNFR
jgi:uncharacterized protein (DUF1800 family)